LAGCCRWRHCWPYATPHGTAPAVAAVLTAVAGSIAVSLFVSALSDHDRRNYTPQLGHGQVALNAQTPPPGSGQRAAAERPAGPPRSDLADRPAGADDPDPDSDDAV